MKILLLTQWFDPEPHFKGLLFARALADRGHSVQVLTGFPNYPGGKLYPGYRLRPFQRESFGAVDVLRVPLYPSHDQSSARRALNYGSFALSAASIGSLLCRRPDVIYVYHPPATIGFAAIVLRLARRAPFVLDIQDLWPDTLGATGMLGNARLLSAISKWCSLLYRSASKIAVLSPGFREALINRGVPPEKIEVIYNWCDAEAVSNPGVLPSNEQALFDKRFNVVFAGNIGPAQGLDAVIEAASLLQGQAPDAQFVFVGDGIHRNALQSKASERHLTNVVFLPRRPVQQIGAVLNRADALLVHLKDDPLFRITVPSKTQAYLAVGKPIIMGVRGDAANLVETAKAGVVCEPESAESIASAVLRLKSMPPAELLSLGANARRFYQAELSLGHGISHFERLFKSAIEHF